MGRCYYYLREHIPSDNLQQRPSDAEIYPSSGAYNSRSYVDLARAFYRDRQIHTDETIVFPARFFFAGEKIKFQAARDLPRGESAR